MTLQNIRDEIERLVDLGNESALEKFFIDRFSELPADIQKKVFFAFYKDSLRKKAGEAVIQKIQNDGLDALDKIEAFKTSLVAGKE